MVIDFDHYHGFEEMAEALGYREFIVYQTSRVAERLLGHC